MSVERGKGVDMDFVALLILFFSYWAYAIQSFFR